MAGPVATQTRAPARIEPLEALPRRPKPRRRRWRGKLLTLAVSAVVSVLLVEGLLTLAGFHHPIFYRADAVTGASHLPGAEGIHSVEGYAHIAINDDGWRDREHTLAKPAGAYRIAVLGDSYTSAFAVEADETFLALTERELEKSRPGVDVMNFGVSGWGLPQELLALRHKLSRYELDFVVLALFTGNDIASGSRTVYDVDRSPYYRLVDGRLELDDAFLQSKPYLRRSHWTARAFVSVARYSRIAQLVARVRFMREQSRRTEGDPHGKDGQLEFGLHNRLYVPPEDDGWREAWTVSEAMLVAMRDECRKRGIGFAVVQITNPIQVHPEREARAALCEGLGVPDLMYPNRRIDEFCAREKIPVLSLAPRLQAWADENGEHLHGFDDGLGGGHLNQEGHRQTAKLLAPWLAQLLPSGDDGERRTVEK